MKSRFRVVLPLTVAAFSLGLAGQVAAAGITGKLAERAREQPQQQASEPRRESRPASQPSRPASQPQSRPAQRPADSRASQGTARSEPRTERTQRSPQGAQVERRDRNSGSAGRPSRPAAATSPNAVADQPRRPGSPATAAGNASGNADRDRGVAGSLIQRQYQDSDNRDRDRDRGNNGRDWDRDYNSNRDRDDRRDSWRDRDRRRSVHVIHHLPAGYRDYSWNGSRYYYHSGHWYQPYGSSYMSVTVPIGFFVGTLPGSYTSVWMGGTRYYYSDYQYYVYEPARRGYVVVQSPYGAEEEEFSRLDEDLYVYPAQGQSEQQQADDRYECHRWAVDETGYDPIDDEYDAALREDYLRALTACLTGRGYTVR